MTKPTYNDLTVLLAKIAMRAVPAGQDSTGNAMVKMRLALIEEVRNTVALAAPMPAKIKTPETAKQRGARHAAVTRAATKARRERVAKFDPLEQPTGEEKDALMTFAIKYGKDKRPWKDVLSMMWSNGQDANEPGGHLLRRLRNRLGPQWLADVPADLNKWK